MKSFQEVLSLILAISESPQGIQALKWISLLFALVSVTIIIPLLLYLFFRYLSA